MVIRIISAKYMGYLVLKCADDFTIFNFQRHFDVILLSILSFNISEIKFYKKFQIKLVS